ncbi:MAG: zinc ribbon domain-containing protein [Candidatus Aureabacteria bacterium]|nr:zinc ribbon domain-containing protein [Candidatus Auribacterota bacterium]
MPIYEYQCRRCGKLTSLMEKAGRWSFWGRKCSFCGSRRLNKIYSTFSTSRKQSMSDLMGEMRRLGPVNFVPSPPRPMGPPPGGCPYAKEGKSSQAKAEK